MNLFTKLLGRKIANKGIVALSFSSDGIALAVSEYTAAQHTTLTHCEFFHTKNKLTDLKLLTEKYHLNEYDCHLVLSVDDYRLISVEKPSVEDDELAEAVLWKISELLEFPLEDAVTDFYSLPLSNRANTAQMLEVIASPLSTIQPLIDLCLQCGLQLQIIDIQETTLRNLATLLPENDRGIAVLHLQNTSGRVMIEQQGSIYLNRKLAIGFDQLGLTESPLSDEQIAMEQNGLTLEIQRSLDYVESFYGLPPISSLTVIPLPQKTQELLNILNKNYGTTARIMDLSTIIDSAILLDDTTQSLCASVIGATLRNSIEDT